MKYYLPLLFMCLFINVLNAQNRIVVDSFKVLETDLDANVVAPKKDQNGDKCAIIKVVTSQTGFSWDIGMLGIVSSEYKNGEYWIYVPHSAEYLTIKHQQLGVLRYDLKIPIEKATVYEMRLITGQVTRTIVEDIPGQYLVITTEPMDANVFIDDEFAGKGNYEAKLKPGSHTYRVEAPLYVTEAGKVVISDAKKEIVVKLKPNFGTIEVSTSPEPGAAVFIDGKNISQTTPCKSESLLVGEHKVTVEKEWFQPETKMVKVSVGQTTTVDFTLKPTFAEVTFKLPDGASLYVDGDKKQTGNGKVRLKKGIHAVEARQDSHHPEMKDIEVVAGEDQTVTLQPVPIYGSLDVKTNPRGAKIILNGKGYGKTTPDVFNNLLIGNYQIMIDLDKYQSISKSVTIEEGKTTYLDEKFLNLPKVKVEQIQSPTPNPKPIYTPDYYKYKKSKTIWLVSALVTGAAGTFAYLQTGTTYDQYKTTTTNDATNLYDKAKLYNMIAPIALGIAGFSTLEFILKSGKQRKAKNQSISLYPVTVKDGGGFGIAYHF